jgi:pimeloyl-ACP methyl ester carboxylesterase
MGAIATLLSLRFGRLTTRRMVFLAPMHDVRTHLDEFCATLGLGRRTRTRLDQLMQTRTGLAVDDIDAAALRDVEPPPLLIIHDRGDRHTSHDASVALVQQWPTATMISTDGLGHRSLVDDVEVLNAVTAFVGRSAQLPDVPGQYPSALPPQ